MSSKPITIDNKTVIEIKNTSKYLTLTWILNNICTNSCSYCPTNLHSGTNHNYSWDHAQEFIKECFKRYGKVHCSVSGGEPTVSPFFKDLVNLIWDLGGSMHLTTNLVRNKDYWIDIANKTSGISASYHPEFMNDFQEIEFIEKIAFLSYQTYVTVRIMMHPAHWDKCMNFYNKLKDTDYPFFMEMVRILPNYGQGDPFCQINYNEDQESILNNHSPIMRIRENPDLNFRHNPIKSYMIFDDNTSKILDFENTSILENTNQNNFYGWNCNVGLESLLVRWSGEVQRGNCAEGGIIGNINNEINWPTESIICKKNICHCIADLILSKKKL